MLPSNKPIFDRSKLRPQQQPRVEPHPENAFAGRLCSLVFTDGNVERVTIAKVTRYALVTDKGSIFFKHALRGVVGATE